MEGDDDGGECLEEENRDMKQTFNLFPSFPPPFLPLSLPRTGASKSYASETDGAN